MHYEIKIVTAGYLGDTEHKEKYINDIVIGLTRMGYSPYLSDVGDICFTIYNPEDIIELNTTIPSEPKGLSDKVSDAELANKYIL